MKYKTTKKCDYYLLKCQIKLVFKRNHFCPSVTSVLFDKITMISYSKFLGKVISGFKDKGYIFNHIAEMNIITIANKTDMLYEFYIKHNMCALEWKLNSMMNKNKILINKFNRNWRHLLHRKLESYRVLLI